ncbi:uncharacterized protein Aud_005117 [Aspergillus udagawae]|uniref:Uncharacterized protein n=1 Tax=Aspergillus udagawae TaxID=91492 RepID=A0A8E0QPI4_9EURO|nr:uncharacterized protein Aud_005117 [Aspergillus udagawae]GIC88719.1 hypothetical protein Aud_005117 [Aspergillus udagawae]
MPAETIIGAITRALNLDTSIENGGPFSIQQIASETDGQFRCYDNLTCYLRSGRICIYNNDRGTEEYAIAIQAVETLVASAEQISHPADEEDRLILLQDFSYHKLTVALYPMRCLACIDLGESGSWQIIYTRRFLPGTYGNPSCRITIGSFLYFEILDTGVNFEWFDLKGREAHTLTMHWGRPDRLRIVTSGSSAYIMLDFEGDVEFGMLRLADSGLKYERIQKYLAPFVMYPDWEGGVTLHTLIQIDNQLMSAPTKNLASTCYHAPSSSWVTIT